MAESGARPREKEIDFRRDRTRERDAWLKREVAPSIYCRGLLKRRVEIAFLSNGKIVGCVPHSSKKFITSAYELCFRCILYLHIPIFEYYNIHASGKSQGAPWPLDKRDASVQI